MPVGMSIQRDVMLTAFSFKTVTERDAAMLPAAYRKRCKAWRGLARHGWARRGESNQEVNMESQFAIGVDGAAASRAACLKTRPAARGGLGRWAMVG
ncbi:protein of unknown function [Paraburkholderia kururiensis]